MRLENGDRDDQANRGFESKMTAENGVVHEKEMSICSQNAVTELVEWFEYFVDCVNVLKFDTNSVY